MDTKALYKLSYGLFFVGVKGDKLNACVANTAIQVTSLPAKMSVTLNKNNFTTDLILKSGEFSVSVINADISLDTVARFGFTSGATKDKFQDFDGYKTFSNGVPYITDGVNAAFSIKVEGHIDVGSHIVIFGEIVDAIVLNETPSLTYADYHKIKNGITPKNSPSYVHKEESKGYKCGVCGYIYTGENLPSDYVCPVCGQPAKVFKRL